MTITHQGTSARASGTTTLAVTLSGVGAGRIALAGRTLKPSTATATAETGWTTSFAAFIGGTGSQGIDTGPQRIKGDYKMIAAGEGNPTFDQAGSPNSVVGAVSIYSVAAGNGFGIIVPTPGDDATHGAGRSATCTTVTLAVGDLIWVYVGSDTDFDAGAWTGAVISVSAGSVGATNTRLAPGGSATGQDVGDAIYDCTVTGAGTGTITFSTNADGQANCGPVGFVILRESPPPVIPTMQPRVAA